MLSIIAYTLHARKPRMLHRGRGYGNVTKTQEHRPVLVIRWDANATPAPGGIRIVGTLFAKWEGCLLAAGATAFDFLFS